MFIRHTCSIANILIHIDYNERSMQMSIKINASFTEEEEKEILLKMFKPLVRAGHKCKVVKGKSYHHIYIIKKHE